VYKVFPFNVGAPEEVMLYGMSKYVYDDGTTGQMPWSARIHFTRSEGQIGVDFYQIYAVCFQHWTLCSSALTVLGPITTTRHGGIEGALRITAQLHVSWYL
jgi:hypothetical protein